LVVDEVGNDRRAHPQVEREDHRKHPRREEREHRCAKTEVEQESENVVLDQHRWLLPQGGSRRQVLDAKDHERKESTKPKDGEPCPGGSKNRRTRGALLLS